jgi:hypothetical protein
MAGFNLRGSDAYAGYCMAAADSSRSRIRLKRGEHIRVTLFLDASTGACAARSSSGATRRARSSAGARALQRAPRVDLARVQRHLAGQRRDAAVDPAARHGAGSIILLVAMLDDFVLLVRHRM